MPASCSNPGPPDQPKAGILLDPALPDQPNAGILRIGLLPGKDLV